MNNIDPLLKAEDIAAIIGVSARQVAERYAALPSFPRPIRLPSPKGRGVMRWRKGEVLEWIDGLREAA